EAFLDGHITWQRDFQVPRLLPETAVVDKLGTLWIVGAGSDSSRLVRIGASGQLLDVTTLPASAAPQPPSEVASYHEAITPFGVIALLVDYSHGGQQQHFDGPKVGFFDAVSLGLLKRVTEPGPW